MSAKMGAEDRCLDNRRVSSNHVISLRGVSKSYGRHEALAETDLDVAAGTVVGLIGPNGAGKTTLMRLISGLSTPSTGVGTVADCPLAATVRRTPFVGLVTERPPFIGHLSGRANLRLLARIRGVIDHAEIDEAITSVGLDPRSLKPVGRYSHGMRQRLALAQAIMERPPVLLLDEPTNGLDMEGRLLLRSVIEQQASAGAAVLLSSHSLSDVEAVCRRVVMVEAGRLREMCLPNATADRDRTLIVHLAEEPSPWIVSNMGLQSLGELRYAVSVPGAAHDVVRMLVEAGAKVDEVGAEPARLEDLYWRAVRSAS